MKKLFIFILLITASLQNSYSQKTTVEEKRVTAVFSCDTLKKDDIFSRINKWIALNYNSANNVIQMSDKQAGTIVVKGINSVTYNNPTKSAYPKSKYVPSTYELSLNHTIEINVKDGRFRTKYSINGINNPSSNIPSLSKLNQLFFNGINLKGTDEKYVNEYKEFIKELYKGTLIGKKKRKKIFDAIPGTFESINTSLLSNIQLTHLSIYASVMNKEQDDW